MGQFGEPDSAVLHVQSLLGILGVNIRRETEKIVKLSISSRQGGSGTGGLFD